MIIGCCHEPLVHMDMNYRGLINMLVMCGCIGQTGGGWVHYVGLRKVAPTNRLAALAFALTGAAHPAT